MNNGTVNWSGVDFELNSGTFQNNGSMTSDYSGSGALEISGVTGTNVFNNSGTLTKTGTSLVQIHTVTRGGTPVQFNNSGLVDVQAGTLEIDEPTGVQSGEFSIAAAASLRLQGGDYGNDSSIHGDGEVEFFGQDARIDGDVNVGQITIGQGVKLMGHGSVHTNFLNNLGQLEVEQGDTMSVKPFSVLVPMPIKIGGDIRVDGGLNIEVDPVIHSAQVLNGVISGGGKITVTYTDVEEATKPGSLDLPATTISPGHSPGKLDVDADVVSFESDTAFEVQLAGLSQGVTYDLLNVTGEADLNGALNVSLLNGFVPQVGDTFEILTADSISGQFSTRSLPSLPSGRFWNVQYSSDSLTLDVVNSTQFGDFNGDGRVDAADYVLWRRGFGTTYNQNDYNNWRTTSANRPVAARMPLRMPPSPNRHPCSR